MPSELMTIFLRWWPLGVALLGAVVTFVALNRHSRQFYSDTFLLSWLGIYVWGDALILGPFWMMTSLFWWWYQPHGWWSFYVIFLIGRSAYEVIYWLNHQAADKTHRPPLLRNWSKLGSQELAICYQLAHFCVVVIGLSWWWRMKFN